MEHWEAIQALAEEASKCFETAKRTGGESYLRAKEGAPDWIQPLCLAAHDNGQMLPDDTRYEYIVRALEAIAEEEEETARERCEETDVYTSDLVQWVASHGLRIGYCNDALAEWGSVDNLESLLALGQRAERGDVFQEVLNFLSARVLEAEEVTE